MFRNLGVPSRAVAILAGVAAFLPGTVTKVAVIATLFAFFLVQRFVAGKERVPLGA
jgi:hypothetical protein